MRYAMLMLLVGTAALPMMTGCGDKVVKDKQTESRSGITGNVTNEDQKTYQRPDGSQYTETDSHKSN